mmetsp:Transcript_118423/g.335775  ORF Transcript_118423/g.335775 Transcript_118423/m.335775 type:complete len:201 (-) Transcript_118423:251-853(-)
MLPHRLVISISQGHGPFLTWSTTCWQISDGSQTMSTMPTFVRSDAPVSFSRAKAAEHARNWDMSTSVEILDSRNVSPHCSKLVQCCWPPSLASATSHTRDVSIFFTASANSGMMFLCLRQILEITRSQSLKWVVSASRSSRKETQCILWSAASSGIVPHPSIFSMWRILRANRTGSSACTNSASCISDRDLRTICWSCSG